MLSVNRISKSFGLNKLFDEVTFNVSAGDRFGLVGPNGCGKTTLLKIIQGLEKADAGSIRFFPSDLRIGYQPQAFLFEPGETLGEFMDRMLPSLEMASHRLSVLAEELVHQPDSEDIHRAYDDALEQLQRAGETAGSSREVLSRLGLGGLVQETPVAHMSGGQKTRLALAGVILSNPTLLILDEPTNHLDLDMLEWLENWLVQFRGGILLVSHDRVFLDRVVTGILDLDPIAQRLKVYPGSYSTYLDAKAAELEQQWQTYTDQQDEIARLKRAAGAVRSRAKFHKGGKADPTQTDGLAAGFFADRSLETIRRAKSIEKRVEHLLTDERVDRPASQWQMHMIFNDLPSNGRDVLGLEDLTVGYEDKTLLNNIRLTIRHGERVALAGPNGCGKTTLVRTIAGQIEPISGKVRIGSGVKVGYMAQEQEGLDGKLNAVETIQQAGGPGESQIRQFLSYYLLTGDDVFLPVERLSYGERARLMLAVLTAQGCNFLLLDEPINHLDIPSRTRFEEALGAYQGTVLAVVHDRFFIQSYATVLWEVREGRIYSEVYSEKGSGKNRLPMSGKE